MIPARRAQRRVLVPRQACTCPTRRRGALRRRGAPRREARALLFVLRGVDMNRLVAEAGRRDGRAGGLPGDRGERQALADLFGIDLDSAVTRAESRRAEEDRRAEKAAPKSPPRPQPRRRPPHPARVHRGS